MKSILATAFILLFNLNLFADNASEYLKQADLYNKEKDYANAEKYYELAISAVEKNAFYIARKGQFYHYSLKDFKKAAQTLEEAYQKGFSQSWLFIQAGNSYRHLDDLKNSEKWFNLGIDNYQKKLNNPHLKPKDKEALNDGLQMLYAQYLGALLDFKELDKVAQISEKAYKSYPETKHNSLLNYLARTHYWMAVIDFGNKEFKKTKEHLEFASQLVKRDIKLKALLLSEFDILLKTIKTLEKNKSPKPVYTHKILVVILGETDGTDKGQQVSIKSKVLPKAEELTEISIKFLKTFIEGSTAGNISIDYTIDKPGIILKRINIDSEIETNQRKNRVPDIDYLTATHETYFKDKLNQYDTLIFIWSAQEFNVANGGKHRFILPESSISLMRGFVHITSERIMLNGPDLMLHEFFHTVEKMADITPNHGYYPENRQYFPGWKGENGNDYYYWHLNGKSLNFYKNMNFLIKYPLKK